ncbi:hypothetical protein Hypma_010339 [Hypsizygus marmoreus]|uniref:DUF952 domain protein n=1 Tax=Hypsizygus marmoreus TaxID=39966 RepID=A0A369JQN2_HYPMA|nr:hypothetical protein Hypma_010339 [Hypsizygus marmoreus]
MSKTPTNLYKLIPASDPSLISLPLPQSLPLSPLDANDGFIHLSTASQLPGTLARFFADETKVYVLRLDYEHVKKDIRWEDPTGQEIGEVGAEGVFPHLYNGGRLGREEVETVFTLEKSDEAWDIEEIKKTAHWLIY